MKAIVFNEYGGSNKINSTAAAQIPVLKPNHVLVNVKAASLNRMDSMLLAGHLKDFFPLDLPAVIGGDFAGIIVSAGEGVTDLIAGDEVYGQSSQALGGSGSLADYTIVRSDKLVKRPKKITMAEAASLPMAGASVIQALEDHMKLQSGQKILIHGGTGSIGSLAIQLAKHHGAFVAATADGQYAELVKSLGADLVIDYKPQDFTMLISDYDAVLVTAESALYGSCQILKKGGVLVFLVGDADENLTKKHEITAISQMTEVSLAQLDRQRVLIENGSMKPVIDKTFSFDDSKEAFNYFENAHPKGKIIIVINS
ncbi:NADP-dependent oxidoreductase [Flavobacterium pectinovorum]|uniref:NADP-dependent oxidoreductase n=1 Tax=Flavobacterium pectinovorum TaxID=29533 RepID=UPI00265DE8F5|nr:NADP-dependent oxidoreductase [Flavobacterium pectinovorum]WKL49590.1 NADP-dependent oxidoreductase [Flavobacterium pectinovorum]